MKLDQTIILGTGAGISPSVLLIRFRSPSQAKLLPVRFNHGRNAYHLHHLFLLMCALDGLQPRKSAPSEDFGHRLHPISHRPVEHAALDICHSLSGWPVPPERCAAVAAEVARHGVTRVGGRGVLLGGASNTELRRGYDPVEAKCRAGDPLAVTAVA